MKKILFTTIFSLSLLFVYGQQEFHNTQFMQYKLGYNPAYAGSTEAPCITALYRKQWIGLEGAPETQILSFNMPLFNQRVGVGANLVRHTIGITTTYNVDAVYAYRLRLGQGMLGIGLQGSMRSMEVNFQKTTAIQLKSLDTSIPTNQQDKFMFNAGVGAYYNSEHFYVGVSVPRLLENNIDFSDGNNVVISKAVQHFYLMGGLIFPIGENVKIEPQTLIKYVNNAPVDADANVNVILMDKYILGATYRLGGNSISGLGESLDFILGAQLSANMLFSVSYDVTLSDLKDYNSGSIEVALHYCMGKSEGEEYMNPRFF